MSSSPRTNRARSAEVERGAARLAAIVGTAQDAVITLDPSGCIVDANAAAEGMFGHPRDVMLAADLAQLLFPPDQQPLWTLHWREPRRARRSPS